MYREEILDHYKRPRNEGSLDTEYEAEGDNSSCGDKTTIYMDIEDGLIQEIKHKTDGCAISTASTSILSKELVGMEVEEVKDLETEWIQDKLGIELSPMRVKCAALPLKTVQEALEDKK
ncbi:MAG: iron-sulfur cluster assembly scaffold protein [Candidatus Nanohaloarchaea archaeon]